MHLTNDKHYNNYTYRWSNVPIKIFCSSFVFFLWMHNIKKIDILTPLSKIQINEYAIHA